MQGLNLCPQHWKAGALPLSHQGSLFSIGAVPIYIPINSAQRFLSFFLSFLIFIYVAVLGLSCSMWDLVP